MSLPYSNTARSATLLTPVDRAGAYHRDTQHGREPFVSTIATTDRLRELEADVRRAWREYHDQIQGLTGQEYEQAELESWDALQDELRELDRQRQLVGTLGA